MFPIPNATHVCICEMKRLSFLSSQTAFLWFIRHASTRASIIIPEKGMQKKKKKNWLVRAVMQESALNHADIWSELIFDIFISPDALI